MKCDELKPLKNIEIAYNTTSQQEQVIAEDSESNCYGFDSWEEIYLKDEVDAAIAELKQKLHDAEMQADLAECAVTEYKIDCDKLKDENRKQKSEIEELKEQVHEYALGSYVLKAKAEKEARHNKYKRCLNKAEWCKERSARYDALQEHSGFSWRREIDFYFRWYQRWLELAEQFKDKET